MSQLKDISFVMVGPIAGARYKENLAKIQHFSNTYENFCYLGPIPHAELKDYLFHASVGIIPFKLTPLTNEINPVKLFEYAAFGLPIVASNMSELQNYNEHVSLYRNKEDYIKLICNNLVKNDALSLQLRNFALNNSWEKRYEYIIAKLEDIKTDAH